jgi:hypothetical protein
LFDQGNRHCDLNQATPYAGVDCFIGCALGNDHSYYSLLIMHHVRPLAARTS